MAKMTLAEGVRFVIEIAQMNGISAIAPVLAVGWVQILRNGELKGATLKQVCASFNYLGRKGFIRRIRRAENSWLDLWETVPNVKLRG